MPLTKEEVLEKMKDPVVILLNVLGEQDFLKLHIKGSVCLTLGQNIRNFAPTVLRKFGKQAYFITYGADSANSVGLNAARLLAEKGMQADYYSGGLQEWAKAGL